eukprot:s2374_g3.t1
MQLCDCRPEEAIRRERDSWHLLRAEQDVALAHLPTLAAPPQRRRPPPAESEAPPRPPRAQSLHRQLLEFDLRKREVARAQAAPAQEQRRSSHAYAAEHAASRSRSPEAAAIVEAVPVQELSDRIAAQLTSKKLVQESDLEDLKFHVMTILQPALKKTSYEEVQRLTVELTEARTRTAAARSEISRLRSEAQLLEQKSAEADEKSRRAETRATKAENRLKSQIGTSDDLAQPFHANARGSVTGGAPGAHSPRRSITSGQLSIGGGGSPEPSEVGEGGEDAGHRAQRLLEKQRKKEEADAARRAAEERMKDQKKKKQEEKSNKEPPGAYGAFRGPLGEVSEFRGIMYFYVCMADDCLARFSKWTVALDHMRACDSYQRLVRD